MGLVDELSARIDSARAAYNERVNAATDAFNKAAGAYHDEIDAANAEFSAIAIQSVNGSRTRRSVMALRSSNRTPAAKIQMRRQSLASMNRCSRRLSPTENCQDRWRSRVRLTRWGSVRSRSHSSPD